MQSRFARRQAARCPQLSNGRLRRRTEISASGYGMIVVLFVISIIGGFLSGFLGLGGAVVMIPLMLSVPPLFGVGELTMKQVAGLSMVQVMFSSVSGIVIHKKNRFVHTGALFYIGIPMAVFSLAGSWVSQLMDERLMLTLFGGLVVAAFIILLLDKSCQGKDSPDIADISLNKPLSIVIGSLVGGVAGIVGAGGGFILIPLMVRFLKMPIKITVGTSLGIVFIGAIFGAIGKVASAQVEYGYVAPVVIGSLLAAQLGARVSKLTPQSIIRYSLLAVMAVSILQVGWKLYAN
jgi:hypothetical protein